MDRIFNPKSIAIIGASSRAGSIGNMVVQNLIDSKYTGKIIPINPTAPEILGFRAFKTVNDVTDDEVDLAVYAVPEKFVVGAARDCSKKRVAGHVVITSGFSEVGNHGPERELVEVVRASGGRVLGPNIVGLLVNGCNANASFAPYLPYRGSTALVSQSGALIIALDGTTYLRHFGCSSMISLGNMSDINFADVIRYLTHDPTTKCIGLYIEGLHDGRAFIEAASACEKPIVALKSGVSAHGAAAAASHTGSLAGSIKVYDAAFKQAKVLRAENLEELLVMSQTLGMQPPMMGKNVLVITNGGGIGVLSSDAAEVAGVPLNTAPKDLQDQLYKCMPSFGSPKNPVDITGGTGAKGYEDSIAIALRHEWVHGLAVLYCETGVTNPLEIAQSIERAVSGAKGFGGEAKPVVCCFVGGQRSVDAAFYLMDKSIPVFTEPKSTMSAIGALRRHGINVALRKVDTPFVPFSDTTASKQRAIEVISSVRAAGRLGLTEPESYEIFTAYHLPMPKEVLAKTEDQAVEFAHKIGFPVVMKIVSPQILHKSDIGGVKVNIKDDAGVRAAFNTIKQNALKAKSDAEIHGILVCEMASWGKEVIVGSVNDATFGPAVMFGMGGIFVEVLKDVTFRVAPFTPAVAKAMMPEIRSYPILTGIRGEKPRDVDALAQIISRMSQIAADLANEIAEIDANPVLVYEEGKGCCVVDARVILKDKTPKAAAPAHGH